MRQVLQHGIIVGGGIAGPLLALFLKRVGISSTVYEAEDGCPQSSAGLQIAPNGMNVLAAIGLADEVCRRGMVASHFRFCNHTGRTLAVVRNGDASVYGQPAVMISRSLLHQIVLDAACRDGIRIEYGKRFRRLFPDAGITAEFEDGTCTHGDFLVGADGLHSRVREYVAPGTKPQHTGLIGLGGFVPRSAFRSLIEPQESVLTMMFGPGGFFGYGNCGTAKGSVTLWWSNLPSERSKSELAGLACDEIRRELQRVHTGWDGPVESLIATSPSILRNAIYDMPALPQWHKGRVVLIGDAAHAMSPHAGQGASVSMEDAMYLAKTMSEDPETAFVRYERERRPRVDRINEQSRRNGQRKKLKHPAGVWLRDRLLSVLLPTFLERGQDWIFRYRIDLAHS